MVSCRVTTRRPCQFISQHPKHTTPWPSAPHTARHAPAATPAVPQPPHTQTRNSYALPSVRSRCRQPPPLRLTDSAAQAPRETSRCVSDTSLRWLRRFLVRLVLPELPLKLLRIVTHHSVGSSDSSCALCSRRSFRSSSSTSWRALSAASLAICSKRCPRACVRRTPPQCVRRARALEVAPRGSASEGSLKHACADFLHLLPRPPLSSPPHLPLDRLSLSLAHFPPDLFRVFEVLRQFVSGLCLPISHTERERGREGEREREREKERERGMAPPARRAPPPSLQQQQQQQPSGPPPPPSPSPQRRASQQPSAQHTLSTHTRTHSHAGAHTHTPCSPIGHPAGQIGGTP